MSKGKHRGFVPQPPMRGGPGGGAGGGGNMMSQIQKLQEEMGKTQEALKSETVTVSVGGEAVTVVATGDQRITSITLKPEAVDPGDVEMLQDLLVAAVNEALAQSQALASKRMAALTGGLSLPGLF